MAFIRENVQNSGLVNSAVDTYLKELTASSLLISFSG